MLLPWRQTDRRTFRPSVDITKIGPKALKFIFVLLPINYFLMGYVWFELQKQPFLPPLVASPSPGLQNTSFWCSYPNFNPTVMFYWWSLEPTSDIILRQWEVNFRECDQFHSLGPFWQWALWTAFLTCVYNHVELSLWHSSCLPSEVALGVVLIHLACPDFVVVF